MGCCTSSSATSPSSQQQQNQNQNNTKIVDASNETAQAAAVSSSKPSGTTTKILVLVYSTYGHNIAMAKAAVEGASQVPNTTVDLRRAAETLPEEVLEKLGAVEAQKAFHDAVQVLADPNALADYDGIIFCFPTRFGMMPAQMKSLIDATGGLWFQGKLIGKVGSVITSSANQHNGQESTILNFHTTLLHHGMSVVGLPSSWGKHGDTTTLNGCSFYGASTITGGDGSRMPSELELDGAKFQGKHVAEITAKLTATA